MEPMKKVTPSTGLFWKDLSFALLVVVFWMFMFLGNALVNVRDLLEGTDVTEQPRLYISYLAIAVLVCCGVISIRTLLKKDGETDMMSGIMMGLVTILHAYFAFVLLDGLGFFSNWMN